MATSNTSDYFYKIYGDYHTGTVVILVAIAVQILSIICNFAIVWYENNTSDNRRTLINKLVKLVACYTILYNVFVHPTLIFRVLFGPLPWLYCELVMFSRAVIFISIIFVLDIITLGRFLYLYCFRSLGILNEDFWYHFISIYIPCFSTTFSVFIGFGNGYRPPKCVCMGIETGFGFDFANVIEEFVVHLFLAFLGGSACLQVVLNVLIATKKKSMNSADLQYQFQSNAAHDNVSLVDLKVTVTIMLVMLVTLGPLRIVIPFLNDIQYQCDVPWWIPFFFLWNELVVPMIYSLVIPIVIFASKEHLRKTVLCKIKKILCARSALLT